MLERDPMVWQWYLGSQGWAPYGMWRTSAVNAASAAAAAPEISRPPNTAMLICRPAMFSQEQKSDICERNHTFTGDSPSTERYF